jgi:hypothetical protein
MESKALIYFFFRSWEQRGQNLERNMKERGREKVSEGRCPLAFIFRIIVTYHFPRGLVVSPTQAKWNHSMEHWKRNKVEDVAGPWMGQRNERKTLTDSLGVPLYSNPLETWKSQDYPAPTNILLF